jgi:mRNA-degrading endonuclease RelE of RelBE toxin-antitoxin system
MSGSGVARADPSALGRVCQPAEWFPLRLRYGINLAMSAKRWVIRYSAGFEKAMDRALSASDYAKIVRAIGTLETNPGRPENARRHLREPVLWCPNATWRLSVVGRFRVLYTFDSETVDIFCLAQKGTEPMEDATIIFAPKRSAQA